MHFKQARLGTCLVKAASAPGFFEQVHVIFGGTGAVGGATCLQLISMFEEAASWHPDTSHNPRIVITGHTRKENRQFTTRLFAIQERDHGSLPREISGVGYKTVGGVIVQIEKLSVDPSIPELIRFTNFDEAKRKSALRDFLTAGGLAPDAPSGKKAELLFDAVTQRVGQPFTRFLTSYQKRQGQSIAQDRFRSVIVAIPLATIAAYKLNDLEAAGPYLGVTERGQMEVLKAEYLNAIRDDLAHIANELADEVLIAHTTAVGGMYDEEAGGSRTIRIGFGHTALDDMKQKQIFAEKLSQLYSERGIKMLVTAAAIGVDTISVRKTPPLSTDIRNKLRLAESAGFKVIPAADIKAGVANIYEPVNLSLFSESRDPITLDHRGRLVMDYVLKSGENGYFTVSNADALYRVMRVASDSELGLVLARTALLGDDPVVPRFRDNVCYYTETDYSRQVLELLSQPEFRTNQLSGLQPKALQDLGSAKHQGELHTLGLLILLHRLKSLDLHAISPKVDLKSFSPQEYFERHSQPLTLDHVVGWDAEILASELVTLATATDIGELATLKHFYQASSERQEAANRVLQSVLRALWLIPSLGTPLLYEEAGKKRVVAGYYAAPIDRVLTHRDEFNRYFTERFDAVGGGDDAAFERFVEFHIASHGFADLRPVAVLVTARSDQEDLAGKVEVFREEKAFVEGLRRLTPYTYFATSGLLAVLLRLKVLWRLAHELKLELGSANEFRAHLAHEDGRALLIPGVAEAFRMVFEGLEKNTGLERLDGRWGYRPL